MALSMWSDKNGLEFPSISLVNSRASEQAPWQDAVKQKEVKILESEQPVVGSFKPGGDAFLLLC